MSATEELKALGRQFIDGKVFLHITYDNVNQYARSWKPKLGSESSLESGTAGYVIVRDDIDPHTFDGTYYHMRRSLDESKVLSWRRLLNDINHRHLEDIAVGHILRIIITQIPFLEKHSNHVQDIFNKCARHQLPVRKTRYHALQCSAYDESTVAGNRDVIHDFVLRQLEILEAELEGRMLGFSGDQMTTSRQRTLGEETDSGHSWFSANKFIHPQIELWHMGATFQKGIFTAHWRESISKEDVGLHHAADCLRRRINAKKLDYYPADRFLRVTITTLVLHYFR